MIQLYDALLGRLGVTEYRLELNSIGDPNCRPAYLEQRLEPWLDEHAAELDEATREQAARNPLRALDNIAAKPPAVQEVLRQAPAIGDSLCDACREHFAEVRRYLDATAVSRYELVPTLVRGLDYYTRTTWEFVGPRAARSRRSPAAGRYDGLAEAIGGPHDAGGRLRRRDRASAARARRSPGAGGRRDRRVLRLSQRAPTAPPCSRRWPSSARPGVKADTDFAGRSVKGQHTQAGRLGAKEVVVVEAGTVLRA